MLVGRKYRLNLTAEQAEMAEEFGNICRSVWNTGPHLLRPGTGQPGTGQPGTG